MSNTRSKKKPNSSTSGSASQEADTQTSEYFEQISEEVRDYFNSQQLKSLFPKRVKSTFGTSEKNMFLWQNLYTCLWENKNLEEKKMYLRELSRSKFHSVTSSNVILYNDAKNSIFIKSGFNTFWKWALQFKDLIKVSLVEGIKTEMQKLQAKLEEVEGKFLELETQIKSKTDIISTLQTQRKRDSQDMSKLKRDVNDAEQYSRRNCVRVYGISENSKEDTDQVMIDLASDKLDIKLERHEIDRSHGVGTPRSSAAGAEKQPSPRPIIVKFTTYRTRDLVLKRRRKLTGTRIEIEEDLTTINRTLLNKTKENVKNNDKPSAAWSSDDKVIALVKATNGTTVRKRIWSTSELDKLWTVNDMWWLTKLKL